jgi:iron complex outermembrane receptor protein
LNLPTGQEAGDAAPLKRPPVVAVPRGDGTMASAGLSPAFLRSQDGAASLDELERNGRVKWRANLTASWRSGSWGAGWFTSYFGSFVDTTAATTEAVYTALGSPSYIRVFNDNGITRYLLKVDPFINHNAWISYRFEGSTRSWLRGITVRGGINNVLDTEPPLADETYGYKTGAANGARLVA